MSMGTRSAAVYVRLSDDRAGDGAGVGRQEADSRDLAERLGWTVGQTYVENDASAFRRRKVRLPDGTTAMRVVRPVFRQMLDALAAGSMDALIAYDLDRVARDPRDLEDLIDVVEQRHIPVRTVTGSLDLGNDAGITMARVLLAMANKSSRDTARRVVRKQQQMAEHGAYAGGGIRAYGYESDGATVVETEAAVVRRIADDVLAGVSLSRIADDLNTEQVPTVRGGAWHARTVHSVVTKPRNAAKRTYRGEVVGAASWPAILDLDVWQRVCLALAERGRGGNNTLTRWLTGVLLCSHCSVGLTAKFGGTKGRGPVYWCAKRHRGCGKIAVSALHAEDTVAALIVGYLGRPDVLASLASAVSSEAARKAREDAASDEAQLKELASMWGGKAITTAEYLSARRVIEDRLKTWQGIARATAPESVRTLMAGDIEARWESYDAKQRREVARIVFPDGITVEPGRRGFNRFDADRLQPVGWPTS
jgi:DNA invertase Pin-like site-specific DNA recombinase